MFATKPITKTLYATKQPTMSKTLFYFALSFGVFSQTACVQNSAESHRYYSEKLTDTGHVFTKVLNKPHFKGGQSSLSNFLSDHINYEEFDDDFSADTARVKFIVNRQGGISALSIAKTDNKAFSDELTRAMKISSCSWVAGGSEQLVNTWHGFNIYYSIEKPSKKK
jgi:hypothetical protein